jgi:hypothetical protein
VFRIGGNTFYNRKNKIWMKSPEFKRSRIGLIAEFHRIPNGFPNQGHVDTNPWRPQHVEVGCIAVIPLVAKCEWLFGA